MENVARHHSESGVPRRIGVHRIQRQLTRSELVAFAPTAERHGLARPRRSAYVLIAPSQLTSERLRSS
jgi:hypothetical protein